MGFNSHDTSGAVLITDRDSEALRAYPDRAHPGRAAEPQSKNSSSPTCNGEQGPHALGQCGSGKHTFRGASLGQRDIPLDKAWATGRPLLALGPTPHQIQGGSTPRPQGYGSCSLHAPLEGLPHGSAAIPPWHLLSHCAPHCTAFQPSGGPRLLRSPSSDSPAFQGSWGS